MDDPNITDIRARAERLAADELLIRRRQAAQAAVKLAVLDLIELTESSGYILDLDPPHRRLFISVGTPEAIRGLLRGAVRG